MPLSLLVMGMSSGAGASAMLPPPRAPACGTGPSLRLRSPVATMGTYIWQGWLCKLTRVFHDGNSQSEQRESLARSEFALQLPSKRNTNTVSVQLFFYYVYVYALRHETRALQCP